MICGTSGNAMTLRNISETIILDIGSTKLLKGNQETQNNLLGNVIFEIWKSQENEDLGKTRAEQSLKSVSSFLEDLEYGNNI